MKYCKDCSNYRGYYADTCVRGLVKTVREDPVCGPVDGYDYSFSGPAAYERIAGECGMDAIHFAPKMDEVVELALNHADIVDGKPIPVFVLRFGKYEIWRTK